MRKSHPSHTKSLNIRTGSQDIKNYGAALPDETFRVALMASSGAVKLFRKAKLGATFKLAGLRAKGVAFKLCANSLKKFTIPEKELIDGCEAIPTGIVEMVRLQREGYAYVKP